MNFLYDLRSAGALSYLADLRRGSLLDLGNKQLGALTVAGSPTWAQTSRGMGVQCAGAAEASLSLGNPASLQLSTCTILVAAQYNGQNVASYNGIFVKQNAYALAIGPVTKAFGVYDYTSASFRSSGYTPVVNTPHLFGATVVSGAVGGLNMYVNGLWKATNTLTVVNQASSWKFGFMTAADHDLQGPVIWGAIINRVLTGVEMGRIYDEWLQDPYVLDLPRRNFVTLPQQGFGDAMETAQSIVIDTDFQRRSDGKIRDLGPNGYAGTLYGTPVPGQNGEGITQSVVDWIDFGDITQFNSVASFTLIGWFNWKDAFVANTYIYSKYVSGTDHILVKTTTSASTTTIAILISNAALSTATTAVAVLRGATNQHLAIVFDGSGATNADRLKLYIDGDLVALTFTDAAVPATTANLAAATFRTGISSNFCCPSTHLGLRAMSFPLTSAQVRQEYIGNFAHKLFLKETLEDVPVSLVASYGAGTYIGNWRIISGTWKCSETADGKRWLECVTVGAVAMPQPNAFGTWKFTIYHPNNGLNPIFMFQSNLALDWDNASLTVNGYGFYYGWNGTVGIFKITNSAVATWLTQSASGLASVGVNMDVLVNRRSSDGRFTTWLRGGTFTNWTLINVAGGSGADPSAAETTYTSSLWATINLKAGDKVCFYDPNDSHIGFQIYQGVLNPWELP